MAAIAPSILAADFARLGDQVREAQRAGADRIHVDVMDGHFVPNLSMGPVVVEGLRPVATIPLETHLMVREPAKFIGPFLKAGSDTVIFHLEVAPAPLDLVRQVRAQGKKVGLAINPDMPVRAFEPFLAEIDLALCMTVFPGFGGQAYLPESDGRIRELRALIEKRNPACELEVDGGVNRANARAAVEAGANVLVVGTGVFRHPQGIGPALAELRSLVTTSPT